MVLFLSNGILALVYLSYCVRVGRPRKELPLALAGIAFIVSVPDRDKEVVVFLDALVAIVRACIYGSYLVCAE